MYANKMASSYLGKNKKESVSQMYKMTVIPLSITHAVDITDSYTCIAQCIYYYPFNT